MRPGLARIVAGFALLLAGLARGQPPVVVGLDHVPVAVRNLDLAAADFRRLGFTLKPGRAHADGIKNQHAKFQDGTEIELITAPTATDETTRAYVRMLDAGDGGAYVGFYAPDRDALLAGLAPLAPGYRYTDPLVMLPESDPGSYLFFGPRNRSPTDRPEHFVHRNGAQRLIGVWLAVEDARTVAALLGALGGRVGEGRACTPECGSATLVHFAQGEAVLLPASRQLLSARPVVGAVVAVHELGALTHALSAARVPLTVVRHADGTLSGFVAPEYAHGLWLEFRQAR